MALRTGEQAIAWGHAQRHNRSQDWTRQCLSFVRQSFNVQARIRDAGLSWDLSKHKHKVSSGAKIPRGVPVFFETPGVADHVALSLGGGLCLSNDIARRGQIDVVGIDALCRKWGCQLKGWTDDMNGVIVHQAAMGKKTPNISAALKARTVPKRIEALKAVKANSSKAPAVKAAEKWLEAHAAQERAIKAAHAARAALEKYEVK